MSHDDEQDRASERLSVRRARIGSVAIYDVSEEELLVLEKGSPSSVMFSIGLALASAGVTTLLTLLAVSLAGAILFLYIALTVFMLGAGAILLILWRKYDESGGQVAKRIRDRMKAEKPRSINGVGPDPNSSEAPPSKP